jgi:eukaryotic-like serine/threonine-protein kinase
MDQDLVGKTIAGKYLVKRLLGAGGMGAVFEGENVEIGKRVAIKVINASHAGSPEVAERFRREARAASKVESDNIVAVFDVGTDPVIGLYMVMEYLTGEDLAVCLQRHRRIDVPLAVDIGVQAARALAKAHVAGVIHRDLKPANLFLTHRDDGALSVKILDFGISKLTSDARSPRASDAPKALTRAGAVVGTAQYMSPEQAQGLPIDLRTDVWSLGAVLYEILSGQPAYEEMPTYEQTIIQIVTRRPVALREVAPWVPPELAAVVHAALTPEIDARLADCGVLAGRLAAVGAELGGRPPAMEAPSASKAVIDPSGADPKVPLGPMMATGANAPRGAAPVATGARGAPPNTGAMTNDGVTVRSSLRGGPTRGAIAAVAVGVIVLGTVAVAGIRALRPTAPASGIVAASPEPSRPSLAPLEPVTLPSLPAEEIAAPPSASSPAAPPAPSTAPARAAARAPSQPMKPSDTSKVDTRVAPGKAQIGSAGVDTQY